MKLLFLASMVALATPATVSHPPPLAAWAVVVEHNGHFSMKAVAVQLDATHAIVGTQSETEGLDASRGTQEVKDLKPIPIPDLYKFGADAPVTRVIQIVCGAPKEDPST